MAKRAFTYRVRRVIIETRLVVLDDAPDVEVEDDDEGELFDAVMEANSTTIEEDERMDEPLDVIDNEIEEVEVPT